MLMIKNLAKEIAKNKVFLIFLFVMTVFTSFMFFFIRFSIDANLAYLKGLEKLAQNQENYMRALHANSSLALSMLFAIASVTSLVFGLFYFRFFSSAKKQLGILKALGYKNIQFQVFFSLFAIAFSIIGLLLGMLLGYFGSSIHISANMQSYNVTGLVKGINFGGVILGLFVPLALFGLTMFVCGFNLIKKDNIDLLNSAHSQNSKHSKLLIFADACVKKIPIKNKAPLRIALRRPLSSLVIIGASMVFTVMLVLGWSLTVSGNSIYKSQTMGHNYQFESTFINVQNKVLDNHAIHFLRFEGELLKADDKIKLNIDGMDFNEEIYALQNMSGKRLSSLTENECYITEELHQMYGVKVGDELDFTINDQQIKAKVKDIAYNSRLKTVIFSRGFIAAQMGQADNSFNGVLSIENKYQYADLIVNSATYKEELSRNKVSSQTSAIINQCIGILSGVILIFLALLITFQDSTKDMMILENLGKSNKEIKKLLINIFLPILIIGFAITAFPAVLIAKAVQFSLSLQTGDYMPFSTNILVLLVGLLALIAIYFIVQAIFNIAIKRTLKKKSILQYTNEL